MNKSLSLVSGLLTTVLLSLIGLVLIPNWHFQELKPVVDADGVSHPSQPDFAVLEGRRVYIAEGCIYCHSQQVRAPGFGADIDRNWGSRRSVARDYIFDRPHQMGTMRTGPDLANIGARQPSSQWQYLHLYNPQLTSAGSIMPPFPFLFNVVEKQGDAPVGAIELAANAAPTGRASWLVPTGRAKSLFYYLMSLDQSYDLPEAHQ